MPSVCANTFTDVALNLQMADVDAVVFQSLLKLLME